MTSQTNEGAPDNPPDKSPYSLNGNGLWYYEPNSKDENAEGTWTWLSSPFAVTAETKDDDDFWGMLLEFRDRNGAAVEWVMDAKLLAEQAELWKALYARGLRVATGTAARNKLLEFLNRQRPSARVRAVRRLGWHTGNNGHLVFVMPDQSYGGDGATRYVFRERINPYRVRGTVDEWRDKIGRYCTGNSRLVLSASIAFASALLAITGEESGGVHLRGESRTGKSTGGNVHASTAGRPKEVVKSWRATSNSLEATCEQRCDGVLGLDEIGQVEAREAGQTAYMIANNQGKGRMGRDAEGRKSKEWQLFFLSTGEISLSDKMSEDGKKPRAGQEIRLLDVPADAGAGMGMFENIHGAASPGAFSEQLRRATMDCYGAPFRDFVAMIAEWLSGDPEGVKSDLRQMRDDFINEHLPSGASGQVRSACARFGLIAVAGELASGFNLTGWLQGEATQAAVTCFEAWLRGRGTAGDHDLEAGIQQVISMIERHGSSRFETLGTDLYEPVVHNRLGFRKRSGDSLEVAETGDAEYLYLVFPNQWREELCKGYDAARIAEEMARRGLLIREGNKPNARFDAKTRCGKAGTMRMYQVRLPQQAPDPATAAERRADWIRRELEINADVPDHLAAVTRLPNGYDGIPDDDVPMFPTPFSTAA